MKPAIVVERDDAGTMVVSRYDRLPALDDVIPIRVFTAHLTMADNDVVVYVNAPTWDPAGYVVLQVDAGNTLSLRH